LGDGKEGCVTYIDKHRYYHWLCFIGENLCNEREIERGDKNG
jgi:hypothetical protein